jgi:hypothetical protein
MQPAMQRFLLALAVLTVTVLSLRVTSTMEPGLDYFTDAGSAIDALGRGDWSGFVANQPLMGSFSLLVRAPFVIPVFDGTLDAVYYAGAIPCLLATVVLGLALARTLADRGQPPAVQGLAAGLAVINPLTFKALHWGHPEELLAAALCVGAVLAALRDRPLLAGLSLGLALATKQWALLAVLPVLLAVPQRRLGLIAVAGAVAALLTLPLMLANPQQFGGVAESAAGQSFAGTSTSPWNIWWPLSDLVSFSGSDRWMAPAWVARISHPLIVAVAVPLSLLLWRRKDRRRDDALLLLTLLFLLRCMLDNWNNDYYHVPFFLSLLAWETVRRPGVPRLTLGVAILLAISFWPEQTRVFADSAEAAPLLFGFYMAWTVPLALALAALLYRPQALLRQYHRHRGASARPPAVRDRAWTGGDRQFDRTTA